MTQTKTNDLCVHFLPLWADEAQVSRRPCSSRHSDSNTATHKTHTATHSLTRHAASVNNTQLSIYINIYVYLHFYCFFFMCLHILFTVFSCWYDICQQPLQMLTFLFIYLFLFLHYCGLSSLQTGLLPACESTALVKTHNTCIFNYVFTIFY